MKKIFLFTATLLLSVCLFAQSNEGQGELKKKEVKHKCAADSGHAKHQKQGMRKDFGIQGLTEEQRTAIKELQLAMAEETRATANLLREKKAHLATLKGENQPNQAAINTTIDEITALQGQIMKTRADFHTKISGLLTEEQRAKFQQQAEKNQQKHPQRGHAPRPIKDKN
jgi:Spy/CpxP family protein refolding chaperone